MCVCACSQSFSFYLSCFACALTHKCTFMKIKGSERMSVDLVIANSLSNSANSNSATKFFFLHFSDVLEVFSFDFPPLTIHHTIQNNLTRYVNIYDYSSFVCAGNIWKSIDIFSLG